MIHGGNGYFPESIETISSRILISDEDLSLD